MERDWTGRGKIGVGLEREGRGRRDGRVGDGMREERGGSSSPTPRIHILGRGPRQEDDIVRDSGSLNQSPKMKSSWTGRGRMGEGQEMEGRGGEGRREERGESSSPTLRIHILGRGPRHEDDRVRDSRSLNQSPKMKSSWTGREEGGWERDWSERERGEEGDGG